MATLRTALLIAAAVAPLGEAAAQVGGQQLPAGEKVAPPPGRVFASSWSFSGAINYTDNFSRIADADFERRFVVNNESFAGTPIIEETPAGPVLVGIEPLTDTIRLKPVPKTFLTGTLSGTTVFERPNARGILTGGIRVGHYLDGNGYRDEIEEELNANLPEELEQFEDAEIKPTVGVGNAFRRTFVDPNISGLTQVDLLGDALYVEAGAMVTEQNFGGRGGLFQEAAGQNLNEIVYGGVYVSPKSVWRLPEQQAIQVTASHSSLFTVDENFGAIEARGIRDFGDSVSNEINAAYESGQLLPFVAISLGGSARRFEEESQETDFSQEFEQLSGFASLSYEVTPRLSVSTTGGYDEATIETQPATPTAIEGLLDPITPEPIEQDLSGTFYEFGFSYRPSRTATINASYGERFRGTNYGLNLSWQITPRLGFRAGVRRQVTSGAQQLQEETIRFNAQGLGIISRLRDQGRSLSNRDLRGIGSTGNRLPTAGGGLGIRRTTNVNAGLNGNYGRTDWSLGIGANLPENAEGDDTERTINLRNDTRYTAQAQVSRLLSRRLRVGAQARALAIFIDDPSVDVAEGLEVRRRFTDDLVEQLYGVSASYVLTRDTSVRLSYNHLRRSTDQAEDLSLFLGTPFEYEENQLRFGVSMQF